MRRMLGEQLDDYVITEDEFGNVYDPPHLNKEIPIDTREEEVREILKELHYQGDEKFWGMEQVDTRKLMYEYYWIDYNQAAIKSNRYNFKTKEYDGYVTNLDGDEIKIESRADFIMRDVINVYPDTLCWIADFTYSYNEPMAKTYFWHPAYDNYPVVGITWSQARAFSIWRTQLLNFTLLSRGESFVHDYRLPLEAEWEYAARGGLDRAKYPWGGPYARNLQGCFLANFKPLRGNYTDDGGMLTTPVGTYSPNEYGLYDMAGNVAEWMESAYDESVYVYAHDMNQNYQYMARPDDPPALKRKVIRGGSWKDVAYYIQCGTRSYEYQDTAKSYIGFRNVRSYLGNSKR
jgi:gliding motility-associated lipoprotein GldK